MINAGTVTKEYLVKNVAKKDLAEKNKLATVGSESIGT